MFPGVLNIVVLHAWGRAGDAREPGRLPDRVRGRVLVQLQEAERDARQAGLHPSRGLVAASSVQFKGGCTDHALASQAASAAAQKADLEGGGRANAVGDKSGEKDPLIGAKSG